MVSTNSKNTAKKTGLTPMMSQYQTIKEKYPDILLFYRMGDFYEMFFHDAEVAASALGIALTHRGQHEGKDIPMCGVPVHAMDSYLPRLITQGFRVAVCEQSETPESFKKKGGKGPLPRDVVRVITPGTLHEEGLLQPEQPNILASIGRSSGAFALAWTDMSTGSFTVQECAQDQIESLLVRLGVAEVIYPEDCAAVLASYGENYPIVRCPAAQFDVRRGAETLTSFYAVQSLEGLGNFAPAIISAAGGLLHYLEATQLAQMPRLSHPTILGTSSMVEIDAATRRSLEITKTLSGEKKGSLLEAVNHTCTAAGARVLFTRLSSPIRDIDKINHRLDLVEWFASQTDIADKITAILGGAGDIERALGRLVSGRGGPRDLAGLAHSLACGRQIYLLLNEVKNEVDTSRTDQVRKIASDAAAPAHIADLILPALADDLPLLARDGQFIRQGYNDQLDHLRRSREESRRLIAALQARYIEQTGISSLKIKHNNVLGYHIDVRTAHGDKLFSNTDFIHRQTTAQTVRFTTTELADLENQFARAAEQAIALELSLFEDLRSLIEKYAEQISSAAKAGAQIDVAISSAFLARHHHFTRPILTSDTRFKIVAGRHPVVEQMLPASDNFATNDCDLSPGNHLWLLTGPNMAGKSTFLRQNAHIAILAQAGLYVPAQHAEIGVTDRIFSRVGASDDLARGQSTFMVEMVETAAILNQSTAQSLVILDEIGRGTSTWDGLGIAWACLEYLHEKISCRTLFATHYHELTSLEQQLAHLSCHAMQVKEWKKQIIFLHQVGAGRADKSYGVHVAKLAGLPQAVTKRASQLVAMLESQTISSSPAISPAIQSELPLLAQMDIGAEEAETGSELLEKLAEIEPDSLTPKQALDLIYTLKQLYDKEEG